MSAEWFKNKKEQLRLLGKHPVPGTKAKDMARVNKEACVASPMFTLQLDKLTPVTFSQKLKTTLFFSFFIIRNHFIRKWALDKPLEIFEAQMKNPSKKVRGIRP